MVGSGLSGRGTRKAVRIWLTTSDRDLVVGTNQCFTVSSMLVKLLIEFKFMREAISMGVKSEPLQIKSAV